MTCFLSSSIDVLNLLSRYSNILKRNDIMTLQDFLHTKDDTILCFKGANPDRKNDLIALRNFLQDSFASDIILNIDPSALAEKFFLLFTSPPTSAPPKPKTPKPKTPKPSKPAESLPLIVLEPVRDIPIDRLSLSIRAKHVLAHKNITFVSQIVNFSMEDFLNLRNIGVKTATELFLAVQKTRVELLSPDFISNLPREDILESSQQPLTLEDLEMSARARNVLHSMNISSMDAFLQCQGADFIEVENCGNGTAAELAALAKSLAGYTTTLNSDEKYALRDTAAFLKIWPNTIMLAADAHKKESVNLSVGALLDLTLAEPPFFDTLKGAVLSLVKSFSGGVTLSQLLEKGFLPFSDCTSFLTAIRSLEDDKKIEIDGDTLTYLTPSLLDTLAAQPDSREKDIFMLKLQGQTLEEIAKPLGLTRERVRQKISKYLPTFPAVDEDKYTYLFTTYYISAEDFALSFGTTPEVYEYLQCKHSRNKGHLPLAECQDDEKLPSSMRKQLERALYKNYITVDGVRLLKSRPVLIAYTVRKYAQTPTTFSEFTDNYNAFLAEYDLQDDSHFQINNQRTYTNHLSAADYILWSQWQRFRYYDIKSRDFTDFLQELDLSQYRDIEITTLKIWREHLDLMQQYDIRDEYELHNLLRKILTPEQVSDLQLDFGKMPTLIFGKADRDMQVLEQLMLYAPIPINDLGKRYEEAYGVKAATAIGTYFKSIDTYFHDGIYRIDSKDLTHEQYQHMRSLMTEDIYLIDDVKRMYQRAYPDAPASDISPYTLKVLGFNVYTGYVIRDTFFSARKYFQATYFSKDIFDLTTMSCALYNTSAFNVELHKCLTARDLTAYAPKQYINIHRLEQSGVTKATMEDYCAKVYAFVCTSNLDIFTITTLHKLGFSHELDDLGFDNYFYASVLSVDREHFDCCRIAGQWGFSPAGTYPSITRSTLIESIVRREGKIEIYDLVARCKEEYGILTNKDDVKLFIDNTSLYYDAIMQTVYANYDLYLEEF